MLARKRAVVITNLKDGDVLAPVEPTAGGFCEEGHGRRFHTRIDLIKPSG